MPPSRLLLALLALPVGGCLGTQDLADPIVRIESAGGRELGVSTEYGVVFLGRTARAGDVRVTAWFGDGPDVESSIIELVSDELCTAEVPIRLPSVRMSFVRPEPGEELLLVGRFGHEVWEQRVRVLSDPRVDGTLLPVPEQFLATVDQVGTGVFRIDPDTDERKLVGLVSGRLTIEGADGAREFLTVVGPDDLWRFVANRRDVGRKRRWVYRPDVL